VGEIVPGGRKIVTVGGRSIGVFNLDGEFFALRNRCPHQGGPLCEGSLWGRLSARAPGEIEYQRGGIVSCGWHGWEFDIRTGQSWCDPVRLRVRAYPVSVEAGETLLEDAEAPRPGQVKGPYVAETYAVEVDGAYVVVDLPDA
jgi:3-phenylpropionate/trans-cinnamate dioxygenase ferredoxin subunit